MHIRRASVIAALTSAVLLALGPASFASASAAHSTAPESWDRYSPTSLSCPSAVECWATLDRSPDLQRWDGNTWSRDVMPQLPNTNDQTLGILNDVTCVSAADCWAVGYRWPDDGRSLLRQELAYHWNGATWTIVTTPVLANSQLTKVSCSSATDCWALGWYSAKNYTGPVHALHWNGHSWKLVHLPARGSEPSLDSLSCVQGQCWATINTVYSSSGKAFLLHFAKGRWGYAALPQRIANVVGAVSCPTARSCWLVGQDSQDGTQLTAHWNGVAWAIISTPLPPGADKYYTGVLSLGCRSAKDCWEVGGYAGAKHPTAQHPMTLHWNGKRWAYIPAPALGTTSYVSTIACSSANSCIAGGGYDRIPLASFPAHPVLLHWDGHHWTS
jgi:hypothetical protein